MILECKEYCVAFGGNESFITEKFVVYKMHAVLVIIKIVEMYSTFLYSWDVLKIIGLFSWIVFGFICLFFVSSVLSSESEIDVNH